MIKNEELSYKDKKVRMMVHSIADSIKLVIRKNIYNNHKLYSKGIKGDIDEC